MRDSADHHFARFCARGDAADLGVVFDECALELLGVAEHLTRDFATAEDLVQSTFLAAIQSAPEFRVGERVRPWLVGILRNFARRESARPKGPSPQSEPSTTSAAHAAVAGEITDEVRARVAGLPQPYREVIELRLFSGFSNSAIAARLHRPPGTVRSQLSRGLEMIRLGLPAGLTGGLTAGLTAGLVCGANLPAMRVALLRAAEASTATVGATATTTTTATAVATAGVFMKINVLAIASICLLAASLAWWALDSETPSSTLDASRPSPSVEHDPTLTQTVEGQRKERQTREEIAPPPLRTRGLAAANPFKLKVKPELATQRLLVKVVDSAGNPVPGARVHLCTDQATFFLGGFNSMSGKTKSISSGTFHTAPPSEVQVADEQGHASLNVHPLHTHLLAAKSAVGTSGRVAIPTGTPGTEQRWCVAFREGTTIRGRVLDRHGRPVAGAKVTTLGDLRQYFFGNTVVTQSNGSFSVAIERPGRFNLSAKVGQETTERVGILIDDSMTSKYVELCVPGRCNLVGVVLDPSGRPAPKATVTVWRDEKQPQTDRPSLKKGDCDATGNYTVPLGRPGVYRIFASCKGFANSILIERSIAAAGGQRDDVLKLQKFAEIRGRVVGADSQPLVSLSINASIGAGDDSMGMSLRTIYGPEAFIRGCSDKNGEFILHGLNPDASYKVTVFLHPTLYLLKLSNPKVPAGTLDLLFVASDEQRVSATLHCRLSNPANKRTLKKFAARLWKLHGKKWWPQPVALDPHAAARGEFVVKGLAIGAEYALVVQADGFAPLVTPRFRMNSAEQHMELALHDFSNVSLIVSGLTGTASTNRRITITRQVKHPEPLDAPPAIADANGRATVKLPPGKFRASCGKQSVDFEVLPETRAIAHLR